MKKIIASVLILTILICSLSSALATSATFRGVPWGSDYVSTLSFLKPLDFRNLTKDHGTTVKNSLLGKKDTFKYDVGFSVTCFNTDVAVAGYYPDRIILSFVYVKDSNEKINQLAEESIFYKGTYQFNLKDRDTGISCFKDIEEKLNYLYGTQIDNDDNWPLPFSDEDNYRLWETDDSYIMLKFHKDNSLFNTDKSCLVKIIYAWKDADDFLTFAESYLKKVNITLNNDGL